jgi:2-dehydro-3-deoxygluconokinase
LTTSRLLTVVHTVNVRPREILRILILLRNVQHCCSLSSTLCTVRRDEQTRVEAGAVSAGDGDSTEVVCVGETMALLIPDPPATAAAAATFRREIGGAESNVAIPLARSGHRVAWRGVLGDDGFGEYIAQRLAAEGVTVDARIDPARPTGLYLKELSRYGSRVRYYRTGSAGSALAEADIAAIHGRRPRLVHTTGITAAISASARELVTALLRPRRDDDPLRSFDINYREALHEHRHAEDLLALARGADIVFCGLDEAGSLWRAGTVDDVRSLLPQPEMVVVKQGAHGATAFRGNRSWHHPAPQVEVVEAIGAGDAFAAGFLHGLLTGAPVPACLAEASRLAGTVLETFGDIPAASIPTRSGITGPYRKQARAT